MVARSGQQQQQQTPTPPRRVIILCRGRGQAGNLVETSRGGDVECKGREVEFGRRRRRRRSNQVVVLLGIKAKYLLFCWFFFASCYFFYSLFKKNAIALTIFLLSFFLSLRQIYQTILEVSSAREVHSILNSSQIIVSSFFNWVNPVSSMQDSTSSNCVKSCAFALRACPRDDIILMLDSNDL